MNGSGDAAENTAGASEPFSFTVGRTDSCGSPTRVGPGLGIDLACNGGRMPSSASLRGNAGIVESPGDGSHADAFGSPYAYLPQDSGLFGVLDKFPIDRPLTVGRRSCGISAALGLLPSTGFQAFDDQSTFELGGGPHDLSDEGAHRVVVVIGEVFASVGGEDALSVRPHHRQDCFLLGEVASKAVEVGSEQSVGLPLSEYLQGFGQAGSFVVAGLAGDRFVAADLHDAHVVDVGVVAAVPLLDVEAVALELPSGADSHQDDDPERTRFEGGGHTLSVSIYRYR